MTEISSKFSKWQTESGEKLLKFWYSFHVCWKWLFFLKWNSGQIHIKRTKYFSLLTHKFVSRIYSNEQESERERCFDAILTLFQFDAEVNKFLHLLRFERRNHRDLRNLICSAWMWNDTWTSFYFSKTSRNFSLPLFMLRTSLPHKSSCNLNKRAF